MNLRPYQTDILNQVRAGWAEFGKQLVVSPTGSGKTVIFSHIAGEFVQNGQRVLILVDQEELVWQAIDKLQRTTGIVGEAEKAEHHANRSAMVVVSTIQTMMRRLDLWAADKFRMVIADEADKSISDSWQRVLRHFDPHAKVCGFTATPWRTDCRNLGVYYENIAAEVNLFDLIDAGYLSKIRVKMLPVNIDLSSVHVKDGDFDKEELDAALDPYLLEVAKMIAEHASFRKTLVFLPLIKTSEKFVALCQSIGLAAEHIDGESDDRKEKLSKFSAGGFDVLANSSLLLRGYDDPLIDCIVMLRPTKSVTLFMQAIGRGTRVHPAKSDLLLLDCLYASTKHKIVRPAHLIAKTEDEAESITELAEKRAALPGAVADQMPADLQELATDATAQREESLRKKLEEHKRKKSKHFSAEEFALEHGSVDAATYEPVMGWESAGISERQMTYLRRAKIDPATVTCRGHASKLLDLYFRDMKPRLASPKAVALMRRMPGLCNQIGIHNTEAVTAAQAGRFFNALKQQRQQPEMV